MGNRIEKGKSSNVNRLDRALGMSMSMIYCCEVTYARTVIL